MRMSLERIVMEGMVIALRCTQSKNSPILALHLLWPLAL